MLSIDKWLTGNWLASAWEFELWSGWSEIIEIGGITLKGLIYNWMVLIVHSANDMTSRIVWIADKLLLLLLLLVLLLLSNPLFTWWSTILWLTQLHCWRIIGGGGWLTICHLDTVRWWWFHTLWSDRELITAIGCSGPVKFALLLLSTNAKSRQCWFPAMLSLIKVDDEYVS